MDPASIIGTTSAAITFVETIAKIVSIARKVHDNATGELDEHKRLRDVASALEPGIATLIEKCKSQTLLSPEEESLLQVAEQCQDVSKRIFHLLDRYQTGPISQIGHESPLSAKRITGRSSTKKTIKVTLRILWGEPEAEGLRQAFDMCTRQLSIHLTLISRKLSRHQKYPRYSADYSCKHFQKVRLPHQADQICEIQTCQAVDNHPRWVEHISKLQKLFEASHLTIEEIKCHQVLKAIAFQDIRIRRHEIGKVKLAEDTFEWMVKDEMVPPSHQHLRQSFRSWLEKGEGIFHIIGKPGSGKSTMMNFLANHPETRSQLDKWARNGNGIVMASVFLWNLGSAEQKNMDGMYRTLLYTILSEHRELIPQVFEDLWNASSEEPLMSQQHLEMSRNEIKIALQKLITDSTRRYQYCFFIDGLDEFYDENMLNFSLANQLVHWASHQGVKICVSNREEAPWTTYFVKFPRLKLHLTTEQDIRRMIDKYLSDDSHLKTFDPTESEKFISRFVNMANGVFIWVKLVLQELEEKLNYEVSLDALYQVLDTVPEKLEEFYDRILLRVSRCDRPEAWAVFDALIETAKWNFPNLFNIYHHSLLGDLTSNPDFYQRTSDYIALWEDIAPQAQARVDDWPLKHHNHQPDNYDVEQNETTPWLQHTGWPRLFHGRPLGIIATTAKRPRSAWNEDYLLGQWHDTALRSPAAVEAQLRAILCGVDLMIDRAVFTLAKTSYRSRCWLNTYLTTWSPSY
ncbi:hypothetical protein DER44DRAFT_737016 [Fusarium oxysporum]|nr:hypothetical protein DER44DRAFT_737016 [Fusarium oxysporum]